jgi:spore coat protein A, manganese oxidase
MDGARNAQLHVPDFRERILQWGLAGDQPLTGDFDGDAKTDIVAVRRENGQLVWWIAKMDGKFIRVQQFGVETDEPQVGDYDGDGKSDPVAIRQDLFGLVWYIYLSGSNTYVVKNFGLYGDYPQAADFDGDGRTDIAVFRQGSINSSNPNEDGNWYWINSSEGFDSQIRIVKFGKTGDVPQAMSTDISGRSSFVVFRNGVWWRMNTSGFGLRIHNWGLHADTKLSSLGANKGFFDF